MAQIVPAVGRESRRFLDERLQVMSYGNLAFPYFYHNNSNFLPFEVTLRCPLRKVTQRKVHKYGKSFR
jgi:hypothetical protein